MEKIEIFNKEKIKEDAQKITDFVAELITKINNGEISLEEATMLMKEKLKKAASIEETIN